MLCKKDICYAGWLNSKEKVICSVVSADEDFATVRLWDANKIVRIPLTGGGRYVQRVKHGPKSVCAKRFLSVFDWHWLVVLQPHLVPLLACLGAPK